jgi:hypothetical protein
MTTTLERPEGRQLAAVLEIQDEPVFIGPTWTKNPHWTGEHEGEKYILPEYSLGWQVLRWIEDNLLSEDSTDEDPVPFKPTFEQKRFILWWYAIDEHGRFIYREGVLQRLKGWGKDPLAAVLAAVELLGPCRFRGWLTKPRPDLGLAAGDPIGKEHPRAWVQIAAVSQEQTTNTMALFPGLFSEKCKREHGMDKHSIGKTIIYAHHGQRRIQAVTSSPKALEGGRPTFVIMNETHHWLKANDGHEMAAVIERNSTKSKDGAARTLAITNAYEPSEKSVAQQQREAYDAEAAGLAISTGVLYDSIEAPKSAKLHPGPVPTGDFDESGKPVMRDPTDDEVKGYIASIIRAVRGDATWLDVDRIVMSILDRKNPPSRSRRFWYNQIVAAEDAWVDPLAVKAAIHPMVEDIRRQPEPDQLRAGWGIVLPDEPIVMFFDGSKSHDATGLVGCRISDGYVFTIGVWQRPPGERGKTWTAPRATINARVHEAFDRFKIVAYFADPSHAKDDEDDTRYWDGLIDEWHIEYKDRLTLWSVKSGDYTHSIMWDMTSPARTAQFVAAAELFVQEMETKDDIEEYQPAFKIDGHPAMVAHLGNAVTNPGKYGDSLMKVNRESLNKIDLAVCAVGARMLRRLVMLREEEEKPAKNGRVWGAW